MSSVQAVNLKGKRQAPSAEDMLRVWEIGQFQTLPEQALTLLGVYCEEVPRADLERLNIGKRDSLLLALREQLFGSQFSGMTSCPGCQTNLEVAFNSSEVRAEVFSDPETTFPLSFGEYEFTCRLPDSADLLVVVRGANVGSIKDSLLERCLLEKRHLGKDIPLVNIPSEAIERIAVEFGKRDPQADIRLALVCPDCSLHWEAIFDIVSFVCNEVSVWACRLLRQVHELASAYGWRERDILAMSSLRRETYLEMLGE